MASSTASEQRGDRGWWLDDARPGTRLRHPGGRTIGAAEHVWLAGLTHNVSDLHGNADAAERGAFGRPVVLGALSAAIVIGLARPAVALPGDAAAAALTGWSRIRLGQPVFPGDTLRAESSIEAVGPRLPNAPSARVTRTIRGFNQRGEVVVTVSETRDVPVRR